MRWLVILYVAGVVVAFWRTDASLPARVAIALFWPLGPIAFVVTVSILLAASVIAFPMIAAATVVVGGLGWWLLT